ncbi:MAG: phage tail protein [Rhodopseudomonas sp.]|nr:phage tail protein [Rhodopseudomonas sp.]
MAEPFIGEIRCFGFNFAPRGWAMCNGQLLNISVNTALFSILGTTYGGDGRATFGLPNLQGQSPMHPGSGAGLNTVIGEPLGSPSVTLIVSEIPQHSHMISAAQIEAGGGSERSAGPVATSYMARSGGGAIYQAAPSTPNLAFSPNSIGMTGNSESHNNMQPYLVLNFCIATEGVFPTRN